MICSKYLARFWWEYQWKRMEFQVNDAFLIAETLQVMALLVIDRISFAIRLFPSLAQHEIATSHWQMLVLVFLCFFLWVQQCCKKDSHNNIAPGFALLHFPFFLKIHCYFKSGSGAHGLSPRECVRFARRVSWTEKVLEGHELFNAPKTNCGKLWSKMVKMNHWKVVGRFNDHDFDIFWS